MATPIVASVIAAPIPVPTTDGKIHLAYELQLTNVLAQDVTLTSLTVLDRDVALLNLDRDRLSLLDACPRKPHAHNETRPGANRDGVARRRPGQGRRLYPGS